MSVTNIRMAYHVSGNVVSSSHFYQQALGLNLSFIDDDRWAEFAVGNGRFGISSQKEAPSGALAVIVFQCEAIDEVTRSIVAHGGRIAETRDMGTHGVVVTAIDPQGQTFQLFCKST